MTSENPVQQKVFRSEHVTEGKIAVDEDRSTPIFSPTPGRVEALAKHGDIVKPGQPLFTVEATDMVQAQNDFIAALTALNKARSALNLHRSIDKRQRLLFEGKAVPLKDSAKRPGRARSRGKRRALRRCGAGSGAQPAAHSRHDRRGDRTEFQDKGAIDPATAIFAPIAGTVVQRKVGPGQYVGSAPATRSS